MGFLSSLGGLITNPVTSIIGTAADFIGGSLANSAAAKSVSDQEAFQASMSNTSYQRAVADMRAAGLNPALAYSQGGASTPSGSTYTPQNVARNAFSGVSGALEAMQVSQNLKKTAADTSNVQANSANTAADTALKLEQLSNFKSMKGSGSPYSGTEGKILSHISAWSDAITGGHAGLNSAQAVADKFRKKPRIQFKFGGGKQ